MYKGAEVRNFDIRLRECELNNATHRSHDNELMNTNDYVFGSQPRCRFAFVLNVCPVQVHSSVRFELKFVFIFTSKFVYVTFTPYSARNCQIRADP